jgi:hypothetical protein
MESALSAAAEYDAGRDSSPMTGRTPRRDICSAFSGSRTNAVTSWPLRASASMTAEPI